MNRFNFALEGNEEEDNYDTDKTIESDNTNTQQVTQDETEEEKIIPKVGQLSVDQKYTELQQEKIDNEMAENAEKQTAIDQAIGSAVELTATAEALHEAIARLGSFNDTTAKVAIISLEAHKKRLGIKDSSSKISLEEYDSNKIKKSNMVLEGFMETIKNILNAVVRAIGNAIAWVKKFFTQLIFGVKNDMKHISNLTEAIIKQRSDPRYIKHTQNGFNKEHYIANPELANKLCIVNKIPNDYTKAFEDIYYMLAPNKAPDANKHNLVYKSIDEMIDVNFIGVVEDLINKNLLTDEQSTLKLKFNPMNFTTPCYNPSPYTANAGSSLAGYANYSNIAAADGQAIYAQPTFLGNEVIAHELSGYLHPATSDGGLKLDSRLMLNEIGNWEIMFIKTSPTFINEGWLRYIDSDELKKVAAINVQILAEVENMDHRLDKINANQAKLKTLMEKAAKQNYSVDDATGQNKIELATIVVKAINKVIKTQNETFIKYTNYSRQCCSAWILYLNEIYKKEANFI